MTITDTDIQKALRIKNFVDEHFEKYGRKKIQAKELMPFFIEKGVFNKNHRDGLPIRNLLRKLEASNQLHLIPQAHFDQRPKNKLWFFI